MRNERGFTLVEVMCALTVLAVGVLGMAATFGSVAGLSDERSRELNRTIVLRNAIATLQSVPFEDAPTVFEPKTRIGQCLADGSVVLNATANSVGTVQYEFFTNEQSIPGDFADLVSGFDLNGNGILDVGPVSDYQLLPVRVNITLMDRGVGRTTSTHLLFRPW